MDLKEGFKGRWHHIHVQCGNSICGEQQRTRNINLLIFNFLFPRKSWRLFQNDVGTRVLVPDFSLGCWPTSSFLNHIPWLKSTESTCWSIQDDQLMFHKWKLGKSWSLGGRMSHCS